MLPLICTQNSYSHIDYGTPLLASKSTDYRTSTSKNHGYIPNIAQDFDCRVRSKIKPELLQKDVAIRDECKSTYEKEYWQKSGQNDILSGNDRGVLSKRVDYVQNITEKLIKKPPPPKSPRLSLMKDSYRFVTCQRQNDRIPNIKCEIPETYRAVQPNINPAEKGYYKYLDIYLTENRSKYVPYSPEDLKKAHEDLITFYNSNGTHKGFTGEIPGKLRGHKNMYDKKIFKIELPNRFVPNKPKNVPNFGLSSEYKSKYAQPTLSDFSPYLRENGIYFEESLSNSGPWQDLCPPAMYCTENCHIGTGYPVRAVVNTDVTKKHFARPECCVKN
ncbi:hypothetical protein GWI33_013631 [Rhynchophorus ferrugineus]|uniref:Uncharacterized protein n=1 Tax=Rhynchophorus ferrugineus TaxID=354439 RepID=A0A834I499_RHYFE|nr:hypothetical protein GWI33_013631 [Rhynchophorus ferrugineus]